MRAATANKPATNGAPIVPPSLPVEAPSTTGTRLAPSARKRWLLAALLIAVLHTALSFASSQDGPPVWFAPAGLAVVLVAWFGWRGLVLAGLDSLLVALGTAMFRGLDEQAATAVFVPALLLPAEAGVAWWCYQRLAGGERRLADPSSATLFLLVIPGGAAVLFSLLGILPQGLDLPLLDFVRLFAAYWLAHALGMLAIVPLLLVVATPGLVAAGWVPAERPRRLRSAERHERMTSGDWIEVAGLGIATGCLVLLLILAPSLWDVPGWQLWGVPLLLVVWASLRRGLRGGVLLAATVTVVSMALASLQGWGAHGHTLLQSNLLAQCTTALLVGASADWIRAGEARYRQVVGNIPVVLYSARITAPGLVGGPPEAEITFASPASKELLRRAPEDLLGPYSGWLQRVHPEDQEVVLAALAQLGRHGQPVTCEYRLAGDGASGPRVRPTFHPHRSRVISLASPRNDVCWVRDTMVPHFGLHGEMEGWEGVLADITAQRLLADDLRRTTSMFHALVANLPAGVFFVQGNRPILVNARARQLLGQREDFSASLDHLPQVYRLHRPDGTPYPADELPVALAMRKGATSMRDDIVVHRPDGRKIPLVSWATPIDLVGQGKPDAAVWVLEDLTALHKAEEARRESEARLRAVIETMAEGLVVQDGNGVILESNPAAEAILGVKPQDLRGRSLLASTWQYLREDGSPFAVAEHPTRVSLDTGEPARNVTVGLAGPAGVRWMLVSAMPLACPAEERRPARVVTTFADITAQRQALAVVRSSEEKYRGLVESLPLMVIQLDRSMNVTYINPATTAISGYDLADLQAPSGWQSFLHPDDLPRVLEGFPRVLAGETTRQEVRSRAKDGSDKVGFVITQPRYQEREVVGAVVLIVDLTRERGLELELQRAQRLELVGRLAGGIAHDFNNLLTVVLTLTDLARDNLPEDHPVRNDLRQIGAAGEQAANLAAQLLAFSKQRRVVARPVEVNAVARRTLELLKSTLPHTVAVTATLEPCAPLVLADETQIQQVLMNLCLNARDAMPKGGRLVVRTEAGVAPLPAGDGNCPAAGRWVCLSVQDNGQGMAEPVKQRIFDPFFSTKERGTGLGLAVVQQIVESFGGHVEVWSEPGKGSRFDVWLPRIAGGV